MKKSAGGLQSTVSPAVGPGQNLGGGTRGKAPGSSAYLGFATSYFSSKSVIFC